MDEKAFIKEVTKEARSMGFKIETNRDDLQQIDFGNKKLHEGHLRSLYPAILEPDADVAALINKVAPGRPCTHVPMREIVRKIR